MNPVLFLLPAVIVLLLAMPLVPVYRSVTRGEAGGAAAGKKAKRSVIFNLCAFFGICLMAIVFPLTGIAAPEAAAATASSASGMGYLAAALVTGLSAIGAGIAVAAAAPAAIGAFSENPKAFGKALIFVALGEGVALYGLLISILILNKL